MIQLTKKEFCDIITRLKSADDLSQSVSKLFQESKDNIIRDFTNGASLQINHEDVVVKLLSKLMEDSGEWIEYFIYELDYGSKYIEGCITKENGEIIKLSNSEELYDLLIENAKDHMNIYDVLSDMFDVPCSYNPADDFMSTRARDWCDKNCKNISRQGRWQECWKKFVELKIKQWS